MNNGPERLLIVEDDPAVGHSLQKGLSEEGYEIIWQQSRAAALAAALAQPFHLFILDIRLPDGSGFDLCRSLRQAGFKQPILMLTARREELDKVLGLEMGADDYLTKPYGLRELLARIRALLRRSYGELAPTNQSRLLHCHDLTIDLAAAEVRRGQQLIYLTPTEYRLLVYLAQHRNQALSRPQILAAVWHDDGDLESERTVNVHIRRLREKIEPRPSEPPHHPHRTRHRLQARRSVGAAAAGQIIGHITML